MDFSVLRKSIVTLIFFGLCTLIFLIGQLTTPENLRFLAVAFDEFPQNWFTLITHGFLHIEWYHYSINMLLLLFIGMWVEQLLGKIRYILLVSISILAGGITLILFQTGGIGFSVAGIAILFYYHLAFPWKKEILFNLPNFILPLFIVVISLLALAFDWMSSVGHIPHLIGALTGILFLFVYKNKHTNLEFSE
ncbi:hypothetical protein BTS2_2395 [Bacillus sp. TS-2]|nr:hypothetical protein BTS2_2395 [Bacillus sp. TS-2]